MARWFTAHSQICPRGPTAACLSAARIGQGVYIIRYMYVLLLLLSWSLLYAYEADFCLAQSHLMMYTFVRHCYTALPALAKAITASCVS